MRLFTAVELTADARAQLVEVVERCRPLGTNVRWTKAENLHITLKFIGDFDAARVADLTSTLRAVPVPTMHLRCDGLLFFPPRGQARIVAAGVAGDVEPLTGVFEAVDAACATFGVERERRRYRPHVTIGRAREGVRSLQQEKLQGATQAAWPGPVTAVETFVLVESELLREGARYRVVERFPA